MSTRKSDDHVSSGADTSQPVSGGRRDALKKTVTVGGVSVALTSWTKPVVESVILPAHAQTTTGSLVAFTITF